MLDDANKQAVSQLIFWWEPVDVLVEIVWKEILKDSWLESVDSEMGGSSSWLEQQIRWSNRLSLPWSECVCHVPGFVGVLFSCHDDVIVDWSTETQYRRQWDQYRPHRCVILLLCHCLIHSIGNFHLREKPSRYNRSDSFRKFCVMWLWVTDQ